MIKVHLMAIVWTGSVEGGKIREFEFSDSIDGDSNPNFQIKENGTKDLLKLILKQELDMRSRYCRI